MHVILKSVPEINGEQEKSFFYEKGGGEVDCYIALVMITFS